jgi:hypothetical protein
VRSPDHPIFCDPLPASLSQKPHPPNTFVENKSQSAIRKACQKAVDALFSPFSGRQFTSISALFSRFYCPVGRGSQAVKAARRKTGAPDEPGAPDRRGFRLMGWEPGFGLAGWKFAAPQTVIVSERL